VRIKIGPVEWESVKPRPSHLAKIGRAAADEHTRLSWLGAVLGLSHASPVWGSLADAGHDPVEYGDRVIDHLVERGGTLPDIIAAAGELAREVLGGPTEAAVADTADFSAVPGDGSGSGSA
jgi:hypothetical protein